MLFLATANATDRLPPALLDRLEIIEISGYTLDEKLHIAQRHLLPRQVIASETTHTRTIHDQMSSVDCL